MEVLEVAAPAFPDIYAGADATLYRELVADFFTYLKELEASSAVSNSYIGTRQRDITAGMRAILVDWLVEVCEEYKLHAETLFVCVALIDRILSKYVVSRSNLQLLGCACMLLASKYEEVFSPSVDEFVYISDNTYTREQVLSMESTVLREMNFRLACATAKQFLHRFVRAANFSEQDVAFVNYLAELTLQEYDFLVYRPSVVAAACVLYVRLATATAEPWSASLSHYTEYAAMDLWPCVNALVRLHNAAAANTLHAVRDKYSHAAVFRASLRPALPLAPVALEAMRDALALPAPAPAPATQSSVVDV